VATIKKGFSEIGFNVTLVNMSDDTCTNPFETIEKVLLEIRSMCTLNFDEKQDEGVFVMIYVTGHGYADNDKKSHILLNQEISFSQNSRFCRFTNPYPLEHQARLLFKSFSNLSIGLVFDACREHLKYHTVFEKVEHPRALMHASF
jgi:hypothetical protein